jgi:uncharacterized membrane protein YjjP (DUF1212 family)
MENEISVEKKEGLATVDVAVSPEDATFIAMELGENILRSGGEVSRAEDTIARICRAYGAVSVDVTAILSVIVLTVDYGEVTVNASRRLTEVGSNNLGRLSRLNELSRRICNKRLTKNEFLEELERINNKTEVTLLKYTVGGILSAGGFAVFFGGTLIDGLFAGLIALPMCLLVRYLSKTQMNATIAKLIVCFLGGFAALMVQKMGIDCNPDKIMIGTIMNVIPGVLLANSFRDLFGGDVMTGFFRLFIAVLDGVIIACGYALAILVFGGVV